ncbi:BrnT family toxin [Leptothrix discophora]|uniref:BrnT family toxin n=1 Tax=Leptothrix discophora TaxID=89 RepID=A0ABT9G1J0_LEPDI|nr:BrnT family toxin [Leptothrix discophora]MDP4300352.1 BrnT family toxin [Leptothrix discophora]
MDFTCNAAKNETNVRERGLPLLAARVMFDADLLVREDTRKVYPERRFIGYNTIEGRLMVVVFCLPSGERTHIISFRKANAREQEKFEAGRL